MLMERNGVVGNNVAARQETSKKEKKKTSRVETSYE